ncbi:hypothetical protein [Halobacterium wangiae]|uniref:hypothetical protein n=1 Tax=Halobacterium wangiae TaxID=2902623 RepID=UPI001E4B2C42|nr:hypothetical protein [Halobacterium wangiae]
MQRRAAAVSVALLVLLAAGSFAFIGAAQQPEVSLDDPDYTVASNEPRTIGGTEYAFGEVTESSAAANWTNESAQYTETWSAEDTVAYQGANYTVVIPNESDPSTFRLEEAQEVDRETIEQNGTTYVVIEDGENRTLVPRDQYLPEPTVHEFSEGDAIDYEGNDNETSVASVAQGEVTIEWFAPMTNELTFSEGENTSIGDTDYRAHFAQQDGTPVLQLTTDYEDYDEDVDAQTYFNERINGLWGIVILASSAAALLVMLAFMPSRY